MDRAMVLIIVCLAALSSHAAEPAVTLVPRQMELLGRGVVAVNRGDGRVFVSWRLLGTDPEGIAFNVYRKSGDAEPTKLNDQPLTGPTHFADSGFDVAKATEYFVRPMIGGAEQPSSQSFRLAAGAPAQSYLSVPIQTLEGYHANDSSVGDLDGDGEYEIVVHMVGRGRHDRRPRQSDRRRRGGSSHPSRGEYGPRRPVRHHPQGP